MDNQQLDPSVIAFTKAIGQSESGGDYNAKGKSGESGAYQFTQPTWQKLSSKYLGSPNAPMTPENQDKAAYSQIHEWGQRGYKPPQIASMWNAGEGEPNAYSGQFSNGSPSKGINKQGVNFDVPRYVKSVGNAYEKIMKGESVGQDPNNPSATGTGGTLPDKSGYVTQPAFTRNQTAQQGPGEQAPEQGLGGELMGRLGEAGTALSKAAQGGGIGNVGLNLLHAAGSIGGGVGDVVHSAMGLIPGERQLEGYIGKGVGALANTGVGKQVTQGIQGFQQAHPQISQAIGDVANIGSAAADLYGAGEVYSAGKGLLRGALGRDALSGIMEDIAPNLTKGKLAKSIAKNGTTESFLTGEIGTVADPTIKDAAQVVDKNIPKWNSIKTASGKINAMQDTVGDLAEKTISNIKNREIMPIITPEDYQGFTNGIKKIIEENPYLTGDAGKSAERILNQFQNFLPKTGDITPVDILSARKKLDIWVKAQKGSAIFDPVKDSPISTALRAVRQGANNLVESKVPDAGVKDLLREQSLLYRAIDNMAPKAAKEIGTTRLGRMATRHPLITKTIKGAGKYAAEGVIGGTVGGGIYDMLKN